MTAIVIWANQLFAAAPWWHWGTPAARPQSPARAHGPRSNFLAASHQNPMVRPFGHHRILKHASWTSPCCFCWQITICKCLLAFPWLPKGMSFQKIVDINVNSTWKILDFPMFQASKFEFKKWSVASFWTSHFGQLQIPKQPPKSCEVSSQILARQDMERLAQLRPKKTRRVAF